MNYFIRWSFFYFFLLVFTPLFAFDSFNQKKTGPKKVVKTKRAAKEGRIFYGIKGTAAPAQKKLPTRRLKIGKVLIQVEVADTQEKRNKGLMYRRKLGKSSGMLFVFQEELPRSFWMKNTYIALDIAFFDKDKKLVEMSSMRPMTSIMDKEIFQYQSKKKAMYALEVNKGWLKANKIKLGSKFSLD